MRRSTFISTAIHVAILLWAVAVFPTAKMDAPVLLEIPVDTAPPSEITKLKAGMVDAKDDAPLQAKPEDQKPKAVTEKQEPKPEETAATPPPPDKPTPKPDQADKAKEQPAKTAEAKPDKPKDDPKPEAAKPDKPKPVKDDKPKKPKPAPETKKHDFNADRIAALLNKIPDASNEPKSADATPDAPKKPVKGQSNGTEITMSVNEIDALRAKIAQCWSPPPGGLGAEQIVIKIRLQLNEDGSLSGYPTIANSGNSPFFQAAADSAVRAVYQCQPYTLPSEKYSVWRDLILNFDPRQMYSAG